MANYGIALRVEPKQTSNMQPWKRNECLIKIGCNSHRSRVNRCWTKAQVITRAGFLRGQLACDISFRVQASKDILKVSSDKTAYETLIRCRFLES